MMTLRRTLCLLLTLVGVLLMGLIDESASSLAQDRAARPKADLDPAIAACCHARTDPMERDLCLFVASVYPDGLLTDWPNPRMPGYHDHAPMLAHGDDQPALSESASMLALYAARTGCEPLFETLFDVSAPAELGGTGAPMSSMQASPYYFASPNLCLLHWRLDKDGHTLADDGWLASAAGESVRWLEALSIAETKFPKSKYRLFANCLAWGLRGATDFDPRASGHFEDPGTPEAFDDYLLRHYFGWQEDFSAFRTLPASNLSYNNLMGFRYAAQLGEQAHTLYQTADGLGLTEVITVPLQAMEAITLSMTKRGTDWGYSLYEVEAHNPFTETNLFLGAACAASSHQNDVHCQACTCTQALDGVISDASRWASGIPWKDDEWLVITPTQPTRIMTLTLHWQDAYAAHYDLSATWPFETFYRNVLSSTAPLMAESIQQCGTDVPRVLYDVEQHLHYGELDQREVVTATASSTQDGNPDFVPGKAVDRDTGTRWSSAHRDDEWIALEFPQPLTMDRVILRWEAAYGEDYAIDISNDGVTWTPVYTETNGDGGVDEIHLPPLITRRMRMHGTKRGTAWRYSLWEFEVYGRTSSLTSLDLARRAGAYARVSGNTILSDTGRSILNWYKARYPSIAAAYDPCTEEPLPGG